MFQKRLGPLVRRCAVVSAVAGVLAPGAARAQVASFTGEATWTASTVASGNYADGEGWYIEDFGSFEADAYSAVVQSSAALPDGLIQGYARVEAQVIPGAVTIDAEAQAYVGPGMVIETFTTSATMVLRLSIPEDTPFFIRRSGTLPASLTAVTGAIDGTVLRAGTYDLAGFAWASRRFPGTITLSGSYTIVLADCIPDWDEDGMVDSDDISAYLAAWFEDVTHGTATADLNGDAEITSGDIAVFLNLWLPATLSGC